MALRRSGVRIPSAPFPSFHLDPHGVAAAQVVAAGDEELAFLQRPKDRLPRPALTEQIRVHEPVEFAAGRIGSNRQRDLIRRRTDGTQAAEYLPGDR